MQTQNTPNTSGATEDAAAGLGPVILEQKPKPLAADILLALALLFLVLTTVFPFTVAFREGVVIGPVCAGMGMLFAILGIGFVLANAGKASYLHEHGLRLQNGKAEKVLRYQDVAEMTFKATRMFHNGVYVGTMQEIGLKPDEPGSKPLIFRHSYKEKTGLVTGYGEGTPLNRLCEVLTGMIARRMAARLQRGDSVPWTRNMQITNRGVEIADRMRGREEVGWDRIARVDIDKGIFRLWVEGEAKPRVQVPVAEANFFPGYGLVAQKLREPRAESPPVPGEAPAPAAAEVPSLSSVEGGVRVEYTPTVEDHVALTRQYFEATPAGRKAWQGRVWPLPAMVIGVGVLIGVVNLFNKDIPEINGAAGVILAVGLLLRPLLGWLAPALDRTRLSRELKAAQELARQRRGADPFGRREVVLARQGYALRTPYGEAWHGWDVISRVEWFKGYIFVFVAGDKVRRETVGLMIPPRAFAEPEEARDVYERVQGWHAAARSVAEGRRLF